MITTENKALAVWAKDFALEQGCQEARATLVASINNSFEYRNTQLDSLESSTENKLYLEIFVDNKYGSFSSNKLEKDELSHFISEGIESTKYLEKDEFRRLPDPNRYYKGEQIDLEQFDSEFDSISTEDKINIARQAVEEVFGKDERIISVSGSYDDVKSSVYINASNGFEVETNETNYRLLVEVSLKTESDARAESYWYDNSIFWNELKKDGIGTEALRRALETLGQAKVESGQYDMLLDNMSSARMLFPIIGVMYGSSLQQKQSFLLDKLDDKIVSDKLTLIDKPHQKRVIGSRLYDGEGVATKEHVIIEKGVLKTYFIDTYYSLKMNVPPTIASPSGLCVELGDRDHSELIKDIQKGIWVTGFNGGNSNPTTGDFSFGVEGFLIEDGKVIKPISEMNITGNLLLLWNNLEEVGNDPRKNSANKIPSLLFKNVNFSGL